MGTKSGIINAPLKNDHCSRFCRKGERIQEFRWNACRKLFPSRNLQKVPDRPQGKGGSMTQKEFRECHHIKEDGQKCHSPAMRESAYCYFHGRSCRRQARQTHDGEVRLDIPPLNSPDEIMSALNQIMNAIANAQITSRRASAMLYAVQMAQKQLHEVPIVHS